MTTAASYSGTLLQELGLRGGRRTLLVAQVWLATMPSLLAASTVPAMAAPSQADIDGCWEVVAFAQEPQTSICFAASGQMQVSIYLPGGQEGWEGTTTYRLKGNRLEIDPDPSAFFGFPASERTTCTIDVKSPNRVELSPCAPDWPATTVLLREDSIAKPQRERAASLKEMRAGLQGCWEQEGGTIEQQTADYGVYEAATICFGDEERIVAYTFGGDEELGVEGLGSQGTYRLGGGKLRFEGGGDGWLFAEPRASCDALIIPGERLAIYNCDSKLLGRPNPGSLPGPAQIFIRSPGEDDWLTGVLDE